MDERIAHSKERESDASYRPRLVLTLRGMTIWPFEEMLVTGRFEMARKVTFGKLTGGVKEVEFMEECYLLSMS